MAKPRNSVLYLFDPLQQSPSRSTSPCRNSSPELGASDKENDVPAGDITMFFSRPYGLYKDANLHAQPRTPKGKLIDIGDTPAPDRHWDDADDGDAEHDGSDADGEQSESDVEGANATATAPPRTPLADLAVEETPRPHQTLGRPSTLDSQQRPLRAPVFTAPTSLPRNDDSLQALFPAPQGSPLAEVINSINLSAMGISDDGAPDAEHALSQALETTEPEVETETEARDDRLASPFPEINICAPETPVLAEFDLERPGQEESESVQDVVSPATRGSTLRPPSTLTQLSPDDPRRASVDLYSSFHLQMQSAEMSFDLLNDKISFLGGAGGQDSFWAGGDDADAMFEFDEERRENAGETVVERHESHDDGLTERVFTPPRAEVAQVVRSPTEEAAKVPLPMSPPPSTPSPRVTPQRIVQQAFETEPPSPPTSPVSLDEPSLLLESEPLPPPMPAPAPVPALRIMKKTFKLASRQTTPPEPTSKPSVSPTTSEPVVKVPSVSAKATPNPVPIAAPQPTRPAIRGVQRPPAIMLAAGNVIIGLPPQGNQRSASTSTSSSSSSGSSASRPARVPTQDAAAAASRFASAGVRRPTLVNKERPATIRGTSTAPATRPVKPTASAPGLTRTASTSAISSKTSSASSGASGIRPPSRIAAPGTTTGAGSALPRPASKLPGPSASGLSRQAKVGGLVRPRVVTAPRAPTGGRF
ncbi:hypothetical protein C8Q73DRAFT_16825 [Cubamyces lactineus]|nr:hypothetical protein C8Q73DRAFT_16825 [Cubamyces lactineus]